MLIAKIGLGVFWFFVAVAWVQNWDGMMGWLPEIGLLVAVIHVFEIGFFFIKFKDKSNNLAWDGLQVFFFGMAHMGRFFKR